MREPPLPTRPVRSLIETSRQFERWRGTRQRGERIPPALWQSALELARSHGVSKTSQTLHLDYYSVKRRLAEVSIERPGATAQQFVELELAPGVAWTANPQCRLEIRDHDGSTVRIELSGWSAPDLATFVRTVTGRRKP
jgi:hypothetical protein